MFRRQHAVQEKTGGKGVGVRVFGRLNQDLDDIRGSVESLCHRRGKYLQRFDMKKTDGKSRWKLPVVRWTQLESGQRAQP